VSKLPKVPDPHKYNSLVSAEIEAEKLPAAMNFIGIWEISYIHKGTDEVFFVGSPNSPVSLLPKA